MVGLTTVALLERKRDITRSLFSRYWRDVHGVMAARIPGFDTYTQYHVTPLTEVGSRSPEPFEGIALVTFLKPDDRAGLANSEITKHIHRDEQNVFRRALLYNLESGASVTHVSGAKFNGENAYFVLVPASVQTHLDTFIAALESDGLRALQSYDLTSGNPAAWNETDVDDGGAGRRFVSLFRGEWSNAHAALRAVRNAVTSSDGELASYRVDAIHAMVEAGRPTHLGLRGLDALRTIEEAGAVNQLDDVVVNAVYGHFGK